MFLLDFGIMPEDASWAKNGDHQEWFGDDPEALMVLLDFRLVPQDKSWAKHEDKLDEDEDKKFFYHFKMHRMRSSYGHGR